MTNTWVSLLGALATLMLSSGCSELNNCTEGSDTPVIVEGGTQHLDGDILVYESSPLDDLTRFPPKQPVRFEHELGVKPSLILPYLSFAKHGTNGSGGGNVTLASGNSGLIDCADSDVIVLRNDTCEDEFYVQVVAMAAADGETDNHKCSE